jgi:hypothetical protein
MVPRFVRFASSSWRFADGWACCFGKQDFVYLPIEDVYRCPVGQKLSYRYTNEKDGKLFLLFWLIATPSLPEKTQAATRAKGGQRHEGFMQVLGRRLAKGPGFIQEVSQDIGKSAVSNSGIGED